LKRYRPLPTLAPKEEKMKALMSFVATILATAIVVPAAATAAELMLPKQLAWTAYGTTSSGYSQSVAIGNMLKNRYGTALRVLPGKNDVSRMTPLKDGKVDMCACGIASYFGSEGVMLFAKEGWGPQPIRVLMASMGSSGLGLGTAKDANIKSMADLKGKRVAWVRGGDALNVNAGANLAFGGLSWDDVVKVEFPGFSQSWEGLINDQVDAAFASTVTPLAERLAASPRGIYWPPLPHDDKAAWARFMKAAPYFVQHTATAGARISKEEPWEGAAYSYPILVANASYDQEVAYSLVKAMAVGYDDYKDGAPGAKGWAMSAQNFLWVMPFHDGAIKYFKEAGVWTGDMQAHNDSLVKRQEILAKAWKEFIATKPGGDEASVASAWMTARAGALGAAGMDPVFK
jgi:TRAP transporter TAXI family solute receptor